METKGRDGGGQGGDVIFSTRVDIFDVPYRVRGELQRHGGVVRGAIGEVEDDLLKTLQEVQLGLLVLQSKVDGLVRVELLKKEAEKDLVSSVGVTGVTGIKEMGTVASYKDFGPVAGPMPKS